MRQASGLFSEEDRGRIRGAVLAAEARTSAELVPVVATASGRYDRPEDIVGLWVAAIGAAVLWWALPRREAEAGNWGGMALEVEILALVAVMVVGFVAGAAAASRIAWLRRLFVPGRQMLEEVAGRARQVFFDSRVRRTAGRTGLLVYVSLFERGAAILADDGIVGKLGQPALDALCSLLTEKLRAGDPTEAICAVLKEAGERLAPVLPRAADDVNELPDALVILD